MGESSKLLGWLSNRPSVSALSTTQQHLVTPICKHAGNLIRTPDGRLAILDFGLMTQVGLLAHGILTPGSLPGKRAQPLTPRDFT